MLATRTPLSALVAQDIMQHKVITIPHDLPLQEAAQLLCAEQISGAPVVDGAGRCIGMFSAADVVRRATERPGAKIGPLPSCPFQVKGRLLTGEDAVICTLAEGRCPLQEVRPTTGGRHTVVCRQPSGTLCDWQLVPENVPDDRVGRYMTADLVTAAPTTPLSELARDMLDAHIHRIVVVDAQRRPIGMVSSTDILAAVVRSTEESVR